jgi:hypothetical protein
VGDGDWIFRCAVFEKSLKPVMQSLSDTHSEAIGLCRNQAVIVRIFILHLAVDGVEIL